MAASNRVMLPPPLVAARAQLRARWQAMGRRERQLIVYAGVIIGFALVWLVAVQPAWRTLRDTPKQIDAVELELQQMQRLAAESRELRSLPTVPASQAEASLRSATERLGPNARLVMQGERATLTTTGVAGDALASWLAEVRSAARARPIEASLSRGPTGYSGSVVLALARPS